MQPNPTSPIRDARLKKGLSQAALGERIGVTKSAVSAWENDREFPDVRRLAGLSRALRPHLDVLGYVKHVAAVAEAGQQERAN